MLYLYCQNRPTGYWKEDCLKCFTIYGHGSHPGHVTSIVLINLYFIVPKRLHTVFG